MIKNRTILILGAGASEPYRYPLGSQLREKIIQKLSNKVFQNKIIRELNLFPRAGEEGIEYFKDDLKKFQFSSIDQFLATQDERRRLIGKMTIASIFLNCENIENLDTRTNNWYLELYKFLTRDVAISNFGNNNLAIITFNYDRSLEYFLYTRLEGDNGENKKDLIKEQLRRIPIIHVHGRLPNLPWEAQQGVDYATDEDYVSFSSAAKGLKIMGEDDSLLAEAQSLIKDATNVYFLGFGYHQPNLNKLGLRMLNKCLNIAGTCFSEGVHTQGSIKNYFEGRIKLSNITCDVFNFIQNFFTPDINLAPNIRVIEPVPYNRL